MDFTPRREDLLQDSFSLQRLVAARAKLPLNEISHAIPPEGVQVADFAAHFEGRTTGEERFKNLMIRARAVADLNVVELVLRRRRRPTAQEIRAAFPPQGFSPIDIIHLFNWMNLSDEDQSQIAQLMSKISVMNPSTKTFYLKGPLTAEEIVEAIPAEGITPPELCQKLEARIPDSEHYLDFMGILSDVAAWDVESQMIVLGHANVVSEPTVRERAGSHLS